MTLMVYLVGEPGAGKSSLMADLTQHWKRVPSMNVPFGRDWLLDPGSGEITAVEIGRRRPGGFSGTDALPSAVIEDVLPWLVHHDGAPVVLAEGARLANRRFFQNAKDAGFDIVLGHLVHQRIAEWREQRQQVLGRRPQNESWIKGRRTASHNLARELAESGVEVMTGHPDAMRRPLLERVSEEMCRR